jgi:hypothetical protein
MQISIIGSAGRGSDGAKMTRELYFKMVRDAKEVISQIEDSHEDTSLISGGAAWSDHVAVSLYLMGIVYELTLHLPCAWDHNKCEFTSGKVGNAANYYHELFSQEMDLMGRLGSTLYTLDTLIKTRPLGFSYTISNGFHARNLEVGKTDAIIAYTWGEGSTPQDGGTAHTWRNSDAPVKVHRPLSSI